MLHRATDIETDSRIVAMHADEGLITAIELLGRQCRGVDRQISLRVEHLDRTEMSRNARVIEQNEPSEGFVDMSKLRQRQVADNGTQRQIIRLDVAVDVSADRGRQIFLGLPRQFLSVAAHVEHDAAAHRGKAQHCDDGRGDQQPRGHPPSPADFLSHAFEKPAAIHRPRDAIQSLQRT